MTLPHHSYVCMCDNITYNTVYNSMLLLSQVNLLIVLFGICFFAGGIANLVYFVDVNSLSDDCTPGHVPRELCDDLESVARNQLICFVSICVYVVEYMV